MAKLVLGLIFSLVMLTGCVSHPEGMENGRYDICYLSSLTDQHLLIKIRKEEQFIKGRNEYLGKLLVELSRRLDEIE